MAIHAWIGFGTATTILVVLCPKRRHAVSFPTWQEANPEFKLVHLGVGIDLICRTRQHRKKTGHTYPVRLKPSDGGLFNVARQGIRLLPTNIPQLL